MEVEDYLGRSQLYRRLKSGPHGHLVSIQPGDRAALRRWLSVLREEGAIAPMVPPPLTPHDRIFREFDAYLLSERGLAPKSIIRHLPVNRRFLHEVCPGGADDLCKISQGDVTGYIERHARDWSPKTGKAMCSSLRAFLRYLHHQKLNPCALADCVPSIRGWKLATLPTYLSAAQVRKALDGCDRATVMGRRDHAILLLLARLGLRAGEVSTLTLDDIDWRASEMLVHAKGRQRARMPIPPDVGAAIVAYLRNGRPKSSCRRLFVRTLAPHVGFASGCAITQIAKTALDRAGIKDLEAKRGASAKTRNLRLTAIRSFFRFVSFEEPEHSSPIQRVLAIPSKRHDKRQVHFLTRPEIEAILAAPDRTTWLGRRDHTLLLLAVQTGLRLSELTGLDRDAVHIGSGAHVRCVGKGRKERTTPLTTLARRALQAWLKEPVRKGATSLFPNMHGGRLSADSVQSLLRKHVLVAHQSCPSLKAKRVSPHVLRHSAAMELLQAGVDCSVIALWLGHESVETTQTYLHAHLALKEAALAKLTPYERDKLTASSQTTACSPS